MQIPGDAWEAAWSRPSNRVSRHPEPRVSPRPAGGEIPHPRRSCTRRRPLERPSAARPPRGRRPFARTPGTPADANAAPARARCEVDLTQTRGACGAGGRHAVRQRGEGFKALQVFPNSNPRLRGCRAAATPQCAFALAVYENAGTLENSKTVDRTPSWATRPSPRAARARRPPAAARPPRVRPPPAPHVARPAPDRAITSSASSSAASIAVASPAAATRGRRAAAPSAARAAAGRRRGACASAARLWMWRHRSPCARASSESFVAPSPSSRPADSRDTSVAASANATAHAEKHGGARRLPEASVRRSSRRSSFVVSRSSFVTREEACAASVGYVARANASASARSRMPTTTLAAQVKAGDARRAFPFPFPSDSVPFVRNRNRRIFVPRARVHHMDAPTRARGVPRHGGDDAIQRGAGTCTVPEARAQAARRRRARLSELGGDRTRQSLPRRPPSWRFPSLCFLLRRTTRPSSRARPRVSRTSPCGRTPVCAYRERKERTLSQMANQRRARPRRGSPNRRARRAPSPLRRRPTPTRPSADSAAADALGGGADVADAVKLRGESARVVRRVGRRV